MCEKDFLGRKYEQCLNIGTVIFFSGGLLVFFKK